jgi:hypothetical protein
MVTNLPSPRALYSGERISLDSAQLECQSVEIGRLVVTSGDVLTCSPEAIGTPAEKRAHIGATIPPGEHPVILAVYGQGDDRRAAMGCLRWSNEVPVEWSPARKPAYCEHCYPDGFLDMGGVASFWAMIVRDEQLVCKNMYDQMDQSAGGSVEACGWTTIVLDRSTGLNYVLYRSGLEEGCAASYVGLDAHGNPVCVTHIYQILA